MGGIPKGEISWGIFPGRKPSERGFPTREFSCEDFLGGEFPWGVEVSMEGGIFFRGDFYGGVISFIPNLQKLQKWAFCREYNLDLFHTVQHSNARIPLFESQEDLSPQILKEKTVNSAL